MRHLANAPAVLFLFGLAGSGKTFIAKLIENEAGWYRYDAENEITQAMQEAIEKQQHFTDEMRDEYFSHIAKRINELKRKYQHIVVDQGAYKRKHREYLLSTIDNMDILCIHADDDIVDKRLKEREEGIAASYAALIKANFESARDGVKILHNNAGTSEIIRQLEDYYA